LLNLIVKPHSAYDFDNLKALAYDYNILSFIAVCCTWCIFKVLCSVKTTDSRVTMYVTLTLPGMGFFENLKAVGPSRPAGNISRMGYVKNLK